MQPFSRHAGFFASLKQVEDRLAAEEQQREPPLPRQPDPPHLFSDTMTASPLFLGASTDTAAGRGGESSGLALDFLTLSKDQEREREPQEEASDDDDDDDDGEDIARLMALLGLSTLRGVDDDDEGGVGAGCDCSGGDGFLAKVVGVVGPKCDREKKRVDGWIEHYGGNGGGCREPARLAHLLLAKASWSWDGEGRGREDAAAIAFPSTVKEFLDRDAPP